jgi:Protein of unknown function (DUF3892)
VVERHRVRCIKKAEGSTPDARIARIGGTNSVGVNWRLTQAEAIQAIEARRWDFYVEQPPGPPVDVIVATTGTGSKYLKSIADDDEPSSLLELPEC